MREFDPVRLGTYEAQAWVAYYRRKWFTFLRAAIGMVRVGFGMPWRATLRGAWLVLRANQAWAPYPHNDPERARALMRLFYLDVKRFSRESFDVDEAARLEVNWWRAHRDLQRESGALGTLIEALANLYAHVYRLPRAAVEPAATHRAEAMVISDAWVAAGCDPTSPAIAAERSELITGYTLLRNAISSPPAR